MDISFDPAKRERALLERGLDFADALQVFAGVTVEVEGRRRDYGEQRILCYGLLAGRLIVIGYTPRGSVRHVRIPHGSLRLGVAARRSRTGGGR